MTKKALITGGAGFIGSHLLDKLITERNYVITVLDLLDEKIHRNKDNPPDYLNKKAKFVQGSLTNYNKLEELIVEKDILIHLADIVGVGQSMYQINKYGDNSILGLAKIFEILANKDHSIEKFVIASSNTI